MNCHKLHARCKAECCSDTTPIPKEIWERHQKDIQKPVKEEIESYENNIWIITHDQKCVFLKENLDCAIYEDRPPICRKFGDESCSMMTCSWQAKDGRIRPRAEKRRIDRQNQQDIRILNKLQILYDKHNE